MSRFRLTPNLNTNKSRVAPGTTARRFRDPQSRRALRLERATSRTQALPVAQASSQALTSEALLFSDLLAWIDASCGHGGVRSRALRRERCAAACIPCAGGSVHPIGANAACVLPKGRIGEEGLTAGRIGLATRHDMARGSADYARTTWRSPLAYVHRKPPVLGAGIQSDRRHCVLSRFGTAHRIAAAAGVRRRARSSVRHGARRGALFIFSFTASHSTLAVGSRRSGVRGSRLAPGLAFVAAAAHGARGGVLELSSSRAPGSARARARDS